LAAFALSPVPLALTFGSSRSENPDISPVTGYLTIAGKPAVDVFICFDGAPGSEDHQGFSWVHSDGSFQLGNMFWFEGGVEPGHYTGHLYTMTSGPKVPEKYRDSRTSGIEIDVAPGWNEFHIDLP
jgi:hypothetical protein